MTQPLGDTSDSGLPDQFVERLRRALARGGDFPASAKVVSELKTLTNDPQTTANQIAELILREPSLGVRLLHLVNSSFYRRPKPVTTISQAIVQVGMKPLADMCAGLILLQRFVPEARKSSAFASCLRKSIVTSLLTSSLTLLRDAERPTAAKRDAESGHLAGMLAELGVLLVGYYFPQVYENAVKRAETRGLNIDQSIHQLTGLSPIQISEEVARTLNLPPMYVDILAGAAQIRASGTSSLSVPPDVAKLSRTLSGAISLSTIISAPPPPNLIAKQLAEAAALAEVTSAVLEKSLTGLSALLGDYCTQLELTLPNLPIEPASLIPFIGATDESPPMEATNAALTGLGASQELFQDYLEEIRKAIENQEPTASIVTSVMEACSYCLKFDRVLLMLLTPTKKALVGRMILGNSNGISPTSITRPIGPGAPPHAPDNIAFTTGRCSFQGDPLFDGGWPLVAIPIGFGKRCIGVVYAERTTRDGSELTNAEQAALVMLSELLDRSLSRT
jgi:HD-like signal output (HDOD) protein